MKSHLCTFLSFHLFAAFMLTIAACSTKTNIGYIESSDEPVIPSEETCTYPTMFVEGRHLHDICGNRVVPVGVNEMLVWAASDLDGIDIFPQIKMTGANAVRFTWSDEGSVIDFDQAIENCLNNRMIAIPQLDFLDRDISILDALVEWWVQDSVVSIIEKYQRFLVIHIGNGLGDSTITDQEFIDVYSDAVSTMRDAGIRVPLVISGADQGVDINILQATFDELLDADPEHNLLFGLHLWWHAYDGSSQRIIDEFQESVDIGLPLLVVEFAPMAAKCVQYIDVETILAEGRKHQIGLLAWSWGAIGNGDCEHMGMTNDGVFGDWRNTPENGYWGEEVAITDPNSIRNQAVEMPSFALYQ